MDMEKKMFGGGDENGYRGLAHGKVKLLLVL